MAEMKERPIPFSGSMVQAILAGAKTQTRRIVKPQPPETGSNGGKITGVRNSSLGYDWDANYFGDNPRHIGKCPYGVVSDKLWVRETWTGTWLGNSRMHLQYAADGSELTVIGPSEYVLPKAAAKVGNWVTPLFMPRWASRITLEITDIRVERLNDISEEDARAEGVEPWKFNDEQPMTTGELGASCPYRGGFACLWDDINADRATWKSNPWVWCVEFKRCL